MDVPDALTAWVPALFDDPTRPLYAQAATLGPGGGPEARTLHVRYVRAWDGLGFASHTASPKWSQLAADPRVALCFFHPRLGLQLLFSGTAAAAAPGDPGTAELWAGTEPWLRKEYGAKGKSAPLAFGGVRLTVGSWDAYRIDAAHPEKNERTSYAWDGKAWRAEPRSALR